LGKTGGGFFPVGVRVRGVQTKGKWAVEDALNKVCKKRDSGLAMEEETSCLFQSGPPIKGRYEVGRKKKT